MIIGIDAGHEGVGNGLDCGAVGNGYYEANITLAVAKKLRDKLLQYNGVQVVMTRDVHMVQSLGTKTSILNKHNCAHVLSIHVNAGGGTGAELWVYKKGSACETIGTHVLNSYIAKTGLRNRGIKEGNLHMVRETKDPAGLIELFFIDTIADVNKMASQIDLMAQGLCDGYVKAFNLTKKAAPSSPNLSTGTYRVVCGSFKERANADRKLAELKGKGETPFLAWYADLGMWRVICGSFRDKNNAEKRIAELKAKGENPFLAFYKD